MSILDVKKASKILDEIQVLEDSIRGGSVDVTPVEEWSFNNADQPHRMEMLKALVGVRQFAKSAMEGAAYRQIAELKKELEALGVKHTTEK